jgi:hypothetical protein
VIQDIVCASGRDHAFESAAHPNRIVIVTCKGRWSYECEQKSTNERR